MHRAAPDPPQPPARRPRRWRGGLGLLLGVLLLHASLLDRLAPGTAPGAGLPQPARSPATVQVRRLVVAPPPAAAPVARVARVADAAAPTAAPAPAQQDKAPAAQHVKAPARQLAKAPAAQLAKAPAAPEAPAQAPADPEQAPAGTTAAPSLSSTTPAPAAPAAAGPPPPVYATTLPAPVLLHYRLRSGGQVGEATLDWRHDGQRYRLLFDARGGRAQPLIEQVSQGGFDAAGLAPLRFTDQRRGRSQRAVNFRRDIGRIGFSGPQLDHPAWPGAQDRLSWLAQLAAIQGAMALPLPTVTLFVVDVWGGGDWWRWVAMDADEVSTPLGLVAAQRWQREPERLDRPEAQRVEVWLDPMRGHWPVQLRFTALRSGEVFELQLAAEPGLPPALPPALPP